jgi:very-short-patch-repair endonuclease
MEKEHNTANLIKKSYPSLSNIIIQNVEPFTLYCCNDVACILKLKNIRSCIRIYDSSEKINIDNKTNGGIQKMSFLTYKGLEKLILGSRSCEALEFCKVLNINVIRKLFPIETDIVLNIIEVFKNENIRRQFICDKYRIDLYFIDYKLAIECDEIHHIYNKENDKIREEYIKTKLNCSFIRFNPYDEDFNILHLYNKIHTHIINYLKNKL